MDKPGFCQGRVLDEYEQELLASDDLADQAALKMRLMMRELGIDPDDDWYVVDHGLSVDGLEGIVVEKQKVFVKEIPEK